MSLPSRCPLCGSHKASQKVVTPHVYGRTNGESAFFSCDNCKVIYQHPPLTKSEEKKFYKEEFEAFMDERSGINSGWQAPEKHLSANKSAFKRRNKYLKKYLPKVKKVMEFGCSSGFMLYPLQRRGIECFGIEPSGLFNEFVNSKGIKVFSSLDECKKKANEKFDLIMHFFVFEHVSNPIEFLESQIKLLNKGGTIFFEVPNSNDPLFSLYDILEFERFYWSKAHPWYFNESSLEYVLNKLKVKYKIIREQRYDLSNHLVWARDGKPGGSGKYSEFFGKKMEEDYKKNLIKSGYCDTLFVEIKV